jgi:hypothetical protein
MSESGDMKTSEAAKALIERLRSLFELDAIEELSPRYETMDLASIDLRLQSIDTEEPAESLTDDSRRRIVEETRDWLANLKTQALDLQSLARRVFRGASMALGTAPVLRGESEEQSIDRFAWALSTATEWLEEKLPDAELWETKRALNVDLGSADGRVFWDGRERKSVVFRDLLIDCFSMEGGLGGQWAQVAADCVIRDLRDGNAMLPRFVTAEDSTESRWRGHLQPRDARAPQSEPVRRRKEAPPPIKTIVHRVSSVNLGELILGAKPGAAMSGNLGSGSLRIAGEIEIAAESPLLAGWVNQATCNAAKALAGEPISSTELERLGELGHVQQAEIRVLADYITEHFQVGANVARLAIDRKLACDVEVALISHHPKVAEQLEQVRRVVSASSEALENLVR